MDKFFPKFKVNGKLEPSVSVVQSNTSDQIPLILSFPHSGNSYPDDFKPNPELPYEVLDFSNDKFVDELYGTNNNHDITSIIANFPRVYIDVNRHQHDIDAKMISNGDEWYGRLQPTGHKTGTTLFWSKTKEDYNLYNRLLSHKELKMRLAKCFIPYHQMMTTKIENLKKIHGKVYLLDCHSMTQFDSKIRGGNQRPEIDIGDRNGQACNKEFTNFVASEFKSLGYEVTINKRFRGGEIILRYGWPEINQHILQVEIRRDLYMDENNRKKLDRFITVQKDCKTVLSKIKSYVIQN